MRVAAQLYTVRDFTNTDDEVKRTLTRIKEIGYNAVQISGLKAYNPKNIAAALKENDLTVCATHTPLERILGDTDSVIEEHKLFGAKYVGLGYFGGRTLVEYEEFLNKMESATEKIHAAGLKFLYHNHAHELLKFGGVTALEFMRGKTKKEIFGFLPDLFWLQTAGCSPQAFLKEFSGRVPVVHFKDMRVAPYDGATNMAEIFEGNMDYHSIYRICLDIGVEWAAVEQDVCDGDPFDSLKISLNNMLIRGMFK